MKKTLFILLIAMAALMIVSAAAFAGTSKGELEFVTVTYKVELTTPVELPEGYGFLYDRDGLSMITQETHIKGNPIVSVPVIECTGDASFEWDIEPLNYVVTEDITFTATINNDGMIPVFFKAVDVDGNPYFSMYAASIGMPSGSMDGSHCIWDINSPHIISFVKEGRELEAKDIPIVEASFYDTCADLPTEFDPNPMGYTVNEPTEFVCRLERVDLEDAPRYNVTYKVEFTTPMELPEGYSILTFDTYPYSPNAIIDDAQVPRMRFLGDGMTFEGWDSDPVGAIVSRDMTFTAKFNNDGCVPVFFKSIDEDGEPIKALLDPKTYTDSTLVAVVKQGEALTAETIPTISQTIQYPEGSSWEVDPMGYVADEPHEFVYVYKYYYKVQFLAELAGLDEEQYVRRGEAAQAPEVPKVAGYLFLGWDTDFSKVTENITVNAIMHKCGDVNLDDVVNTGDAVLILRHCVDMVTLSGDALALADANADKTVNTADAVKVLRVVAGMEQM